MSSSSVTLNSHREGHREVKETGTAASSVQSHSSRGTKSDMSHSVTVTRTTTTTTTSAIIINTGYLKSWPGILKLAELVLGIITVGLVSYYYQKYHTATQTPETFFLLMATTFMVGTFLLLLSCLISISTSSIISKTIYEVVYHGFAFLLLLAASLAFIIEVNHKKNNYDRYQDYEPYFAAAIIGLVNSGLYLLSTVFAQRSYKGL